MECVRIDEPVRIGVLGCASIALRRVLPAMLLEPSLALVAVASRDAAKAGEAAVRFACEPVAGYEQLLARNDIEAVYLPLPTGLHATWALRAVEAGKHVLVEKPMTTNVYDTARVLSTAARRGLVVAENFMFPYHHQHDAVLKLLAEGAIGRLRALSAEFAIPGVPATDIRYNASLGGGALLDIGVYPLRTAMLFLGHGLAVRGSSLHFDPATGVDVDGAALLRRRDGVTARVAFGMRHAYRAGYELWGSSGTIRLDRAYAPAAEHRAVVRLENNDGTEEIVLEPDDQYRAAVRAFARSVRTGSAGGTGAGTDAAELARLVDDVRRLSS
jgi:dTDP-3,4-didehydro-2,6-dideoxy-alpha-D-glucose 3-reductase